MASTMHRGVHEVTGLRGETAGTEKMQAVIRK